MASLVKEIDSVVAKNKDKKAAAVLNFVGDISDEYKELIQAFGDKNKVANVALTTTGDADRFKVSEDAEVTVMHYRGKKVQFNFASDTELTAAEVKKIVEGTKSILE